MRVSFPMPTGVAVNMMPFRPSDGPRGVPERLRGYLAMVGACGVSGSDDVHYLTVSEWRARVDEPQRRGGVHTEAQPGAAWGTPWGGVGGVWMASTVEGSCRVWDTDIPRDMLGEGGCCAHIDLSGVPSRLLSAGELVQMNDTTPHESLPFGGGARQFFRLVGPDIGVWFARHSTPNPACALPDRVRVLTHAKF